MFSQLFAPGLCQNAYDDADDNGLLGFLIDDILVESRRVRNMKHMSCHFCQDRQSINLACCVQSCRQAYHIDCGMKGDVSFEFTDNFPTYCSKHAKVKQSTKARSRTDTCSICMENILKDKAILIPCCKNSWFHKTCLQKFANTSGVFFKCPLCNDKDKCVKQLPRLGIFLPEKDADWEFDMSAYEDLYENESNKICEAVNCRNFASFQDSPWLWKLCTTCGASGIHQECFNSDTDFLCKSCSEILNKSKPEEQIKLSTEVHSREHSPEVETEEDSPIKRPKRKCNSFISDDEKSEDSPLKRPKRKFISWFSDDEQLENSVIEEISPKPKSRRKSKLINYSSTQSSSLATIFF
jgi:PHD-like zinc-binding domain/Ring finger domain